MVKVIKYKTTISTKKNSKYLVIYFVSEVKTLYDQFSSEIPLALLVIYNGHILRNNKAICLATVTLKMRNMLVILFNEWKTLVNDHRVACFRCLTLGPPVMKEMKPVSSFLMMSFMSVMMKHEVRFLSYVVSITMNSFYNKQESIRQECLMAVDAIVQPFKLKNYILVFSVM